MFRSLYLAFNSRVTMGLTYRLIYFGRFYKETSLFIFICLFDASAGMLAKYHKPSF